MTQNKTISVVGEDSSGEVEFFVLKTDEGLCVGVGSDHTDRIVEAYNVTTSKQVCAKPISNSLWRYDDVIDHWNDLILRSHAIEDGEKILFQMLQVYVVMELHGLCIIGVVYLVQELSVVEMVLIRLDH